jgi:hypothetical protein
MNGASGGDHWTSARRQKYGFHVPAGRSDALPSSPADGAETAATSRYGSSGGAGSETAPELGAGFGLRGSRSAAPPPRPR